MSGLEPLRCRGRGIVQVMLAGVVAASPAPIVAQSNPASPAPIVAQSNPAIAIEADTRFLADDLLEGREAGTRGYDLAAAFVANRFAALGLKPAGDRGTWFQRVRLRERTLISASMSFVGPAGAKPVENGRDVAVDGSVTAAHDRIDAPLVFAGWGISAPNLGHDDYAGRDVRGKAVVLFEGAPPGFPPALRAHYGWTDQKAAMAIAHGAVAVLSIKTPVRERHSPWERARVGRPRPAMSWIRTDGTAGARFAIPTVTLGPEVARALFAEAGVNLEAMMVAADRGERVHGALSGRFTLDRRTRHRDVESANVVALLPGSDAGVADEHVAVTSHLDHVGIGPPVDGDAIYNGAADNAVGIAAMLEVARILSSAEHRTRRGILFIATTAEEKGLLGSSYFIDHPTVPLDRIAAVINVDGLPAFFDIADIVAAGAEHSSLGSISRQAAAAIGVPEVPDPVPERGNLALSDQYPFLRAGIPVLFPLPGRGSAEAAAGWDAFMTDRYHQPGDDMRQPWRWDVAARWADYLTRLVSATADVSDRPKWNDGDPLGAVFDK